jgi:hypothetical protein
LLAGGSRLPMLHEAGRNDTLQALGKDVREDSQALLELRKAREVAEHRVAQDQQAPPFADQLQRPGGGALLVALAFRTRLRRTSLVRAASITCSWI